MNHPWIFPYHSLTRDEGPKRDGTTRRQSLVSVFAIATINKSKTQWIITKITSSLFRQQESFGIKQKEATYAIRSKEIWSHMEVLHKYLPFDCVYMFMEVCKCLQVYTNTHVLMCRGHASTLDATLLIRSRLVFWGRVSCPGPTCSAPLGGQQDPRFSDLLIAVSINTPSFLFLFFFSFLGMKPKFSCLQGKRFMNWAISQSP